MTQIINVRFFKLEDKQIMEGNTNKSQFNIAPPTTAIVKRVNMPLDIPQASSFKQFKED